MTFAARCLAVLGILLLAGCASVKGVLDRLPGIGEREPPAAADDETGRVFAQFGRLTGDWSCTVERHADGRWQAQPGTYSWRWQPILDGQAMQDVWREARGDGKPVLATGVRIYNLERERWEIAWTTNVQREWDLLWGEEVNGEMVLHGTRPARAGQPAHVARIRFHDIGEDSFRWLYEAAPLTDARNFRPVTRIACTRR